ncbi:MAG: DUF378 domain-containing protein [Patescibacteria group bacterium]|nr:DUF378 domain-containing protein [Patescibacteria group bacterium]
MNALNMIAYVLVIIGGLNWGLEGLGMWLGGNWNVVNLIFGSMPWLEALVYVLVGLSAIWLLVKKGMGSGSASSMGGGM